MIRLLFSLCIIGLLAHIAVGQELADSAMMEYSLEEYVITAQYEPTHYSRALHKVNLIKQENIQNSGAINLDEIAAQIPAVRLVNDPILGTRINMRGVSSSNVAILVDGVPMIGRLGGGLDLSQVNLNNVKRIEVVQGPLSNIYGSNAAAGVINLITKSSSVRDWETNLGLQYGSIGQLQVHGATTKKVGPLDFNVHGRYFDYDQYPIDSLRVLRSDTLDNGRVIKSKAYPFNPKEQYSVGSYIKYNFAEEGNLTLKYDRNHEDVYSYGEVRSPNFMPYANDGQFTTRRNDVSLSGKHSWGSQYLEGVVAYNKYDRFTKSARFHIESQMLDSLLQNIDTTRFASLFSKVNYARTINKKTSFIAGINYIRESGSGDRILNRSQEDSTAAQFYEVAPYLEVKHEVTPSVRVSFSGRYIHHEIYDSKPIFAAQAMVDLCKDVNVRFSIAQGYRSPALKELYLEFIDFNHYLIGNTDLQPEDSWDYQSTLTYKPIRSLEVSFNAFYTDISNQISFAEFEPNRYIYQNVANHKVYGFQPGLTYKSDQVEVSSNGSLNYYRIRSEEELIPDYGHIWDWNTNANIKLPYQSSMLINHRYTGKQPRFRVEDDMLVTQPIEGYHLVDASLSKSLRYGRVGLGVRNILDRQSTNLLNGAGAHSGGGRRLISPGRNFFVQLEANF